MIMRFAAKGIALGLVTLFAASCNTNEDPLNPSTQVPTAVDSVAATAVSGTTVGLKWAYPTTPSIAITGFRVTVKNGTTVVKTQQVASTARTASVDGLTAGTIYSFEIKAVNSDTASTAKAISWAPAVRATGTYRIYETSSGNGSGLELSATPQTLRVAEGGRWDLALDNRDEADSIFLASPRLSSYTDNEYKFPNGQAGKITRLGRIFQATSLDNVYETEALAATEEDIFVFFRNTAPFGFVVRTQDGNFAKVLVKSVGGSIVQGSGDNEYIEVEVSYQTTANVPYARLAEEAVAQYGAKKHDMPAGMASVKTKRPFVK